MRCGQGETRHIIGRNNQGWVLLGITGRHDVARYWSEWRDLNPRPPDPKSGALPNCATLRYEPCGSRFTAGHKLQHKYFALPEV